MNSINKEVCSQYARILDETNYYYNYHGSIFYLFLKVREQYFNNLLRSKGYVLLNDVYGYLGLSRVQEYNNVGWLYNEENPVGDNFIDFGISNLVNLVNGIVDENIIIDFNVDGVIRY